MPELAEVYGTVHLIDWINSPRGNVKALRGLVSVISDEDMVGFKARGAGSANWLAVVQGDTETWHVFGCQIRAVTTHRHDADESPETWTCK